MNTISIEQNDKKQTLSMACLNLNGIRAAMRKGLQDVINEYRPDILCVQELKAQWLNLKSIDNLQENALIADLLDGYYFTGHYAQKKGYSGVGIFSKQKPLAHHTQSFNFDIAQTEGRCVLASFNGFDVLSVYFPSGSSGEERQNIKFAFLAQAMPILQQLSKQPILIAGDFNIAHQAIDLKNWKGNLKNSGFLPEERAWLDAFLQNYVDIFRHLYPNQEAYTWWSQRGQAYMNNVGWRIDYQMASLPFLEKFKPLKSTIIKEPRLSDHALLHTVFEVL